MRYNIVDDAYEPHIVSLDILDDYTDQDISNLVDVIKLMSTINKSMTN